MLTNARYRNLAPASIWLLAASTVIVGCAAGGGGGAGGGADQPNAGELGGPCTADNTCKGSLACDDTSNTCVEDGDLAGNDASEEGAGGTDAASEEESTGESDGGGESPGSDVDPDDTGPADDPQPAPGADQPNTAGTDDVPDTTPEEPAQVGGAAVPDFGAVDVNADSPRYEEAVSPRDYLEGASAWYFGHST